MGGYIFIKARTLEQAKKQLRRKRYGKEFNISSGRFFRKIPGEDKYKSYSFEEKLKRSSHPRRGKDKDLRKEFERLMRRDISFRDMYGSSIEGEPSYYTERAFKEWKNRR